MPSTSFPLAEVAAEELRGPDQAAWVSRLEVEHGDFRAALQWSLDRGAAERRRRGWRVRCMRYGTCTATTTKAADG